MAKKRKNENSDTAEPTVSEEFLTKLIEPFTKHQLAEILKDLAKNDAGILQKVRQAADKEVSHRKVFVYGLALETTSEDLKSVFSKYGEMEECDVVSDRVSGKCKGYGFVTYKTMAQAQAAMKEPTKTVLSRTARVQLAFEGRGHPGDSRKIYVYPVPADVSAKKLSEFFSKFGEVEEGPRGFDTATGKSKGYALFTYKTLEGAKKALEEPVKVFEGISMKCKVADANGKSTKPSLPQTENLVGSTGAMGYGFPYNQSVVTPGLNSLNSVLSAQATASAFNPSGLYNPGLYGLYGAQPSTLQRAGAYQSALGTQYPISSLSQTSTLNPLRTLNPYVRF
eukprot:TRINITY_DN17397_c0_g1_i1.p1 TRINITY_DN17397_c0_g1~~TRINITY_DN17397_c0_g1_i1.p1  ORF type:complete len:353 (-),score=19.13 TRINITY_DN17397_c0_g1_i1:173-1186(-)